MPNKPALPVAQYAVFGNPISHSKSPVLHSAFAAQTHQSLSYSAILAPLDQFEATLKRFIADGGSGANITVPFKLDAFQLCTKLTPRAQAAGAVNTLSFANGEISGDNTDGCGLIKDIVENAGITLFNKRILLLGAGGAARGAILPLLECQPTELVVANRSQEKAQQLAQEFQQYGTINAGEFAQLHDSFDVIINATSASISAERPAIPDTVYKPGALAYDLMYAAQPTLFMQHAAQHSANARDGWGMLIEQAAEAFYIWRGVRPDTTRLLNKENFPAS